MHQVPRSFFDLIPGKAVETTSVNGRATCWTKSLRMQSGKTHIPLTVFCDEPPAITPPLPVGEEICPARSVADESTNTMRVDGG